MCGRVIQSSGPLHFAIVDGLNVRDSRVHNYPPRWNGAPSQELLVRYSRTRACRAAIQMVRLCRSPGMQNCVGMKLT
jgi:hypothetical protein